MNDHITLRQNLTMLTDFYEMTMANGYFVNGYQDRIAYFDMFFRHVPNNGGFAIMAGVQQLTEYLEQMHFSDADIAYLNSTGLFFEEFLEYLRTFEFCCDVWAVPEGTPIFPTEPIVTVRGPAIQAQLIETMLLLTINHQSLIATKANRIVRAAQGRPVMEFGARRAQGFDGAIYGARAAFIGGCCGTATTFCARKFNIPALGTMAHSWVQMFDSELEAFRAYARTYPDQCMLLVDTYNVLKSGIPNAIRVFNEELLPRNCRPVGIRIDSGDITYLTRHARQMLDQAGYEDCKICVSNSLDEFTIRDILMEGACVDSFGVGERMITSSSEPVFGGVYKLAGIENEHGTILPKIKISENTAKITTPCFKNLWRLYDRASGKAIADVVTLFDEIIDDTVPYTIFDPENTWKQKTVENFRAVRLRQQIFKNGKNQTTPKSLQEIQRYCKEQVETLWPEVRRFDHPHKYYVDLSKRLWETKTALLQKDSGK